MDSEGYTVGGFAMSHLIVIFILLGCGLFLVYWLWVYPCNSQTEQAPRVTSPPSRAGRVISRPETSSAVGERGGGGEMILYAMEIEPGTVVLQSPHGDLFRVLREYDSVTHNGSPTSGLPPGTSYPVHYIPAYTRAHVQNVQATAPPYPAGDEEPGVGTSASETWRPLCVQTGNEY